MMSLKKPWKPQQGQKGKLEPKPSPRISTKSHALDILTEENDSKWMPPVYARKSSKPNTRENC